MSVSVCIEFILLVCVKVAVKIRSASVQVRDTWTVVEELDFPRLLKLSLSSVGEPEDL